jgi:hypothetical protein
MVQGTAASRTGAEMAVSLAAAGAAAGNKLLKFLKEIS